MTRTVVLIALVTVLPVYGFAQQIPDAPLTLRGAVELALAKHPQIREVRAATTAARDEIGVARTAYLPQLDVLWQANRATRNNVFGLLLPQSVIPPISGPVLGTDTLGGVWSSAGGLLLSWEAIDFGRRGATVDLARTEAEAADARREVTELDVATAAADAFLGLAAAEATRGAARANVKHLEVFAKTVRVLVDNQLRPGVELSRADAELAAARTRLIEAERNVELARLALAEAVGIPGARVMIDPARLLTVPAPAVDPSIDLAAHPRAVAAAAQVNAARVRDRVVERAYRPRLELQTGVSGRGVSQLLDGRPNGSGLGLDVPNWAVGVSMTFPTLEIFRVQAQQRVEAGRLQETAAHYDRTMQVLQTQEARARALTSAAFDIAANAPLQLQAARDTDVQARARYDAGLTTVIEVAEAQGLLAEAEAENAVANLSVWRALLAQAALRGDLQPFLTLTGAP